MAQNDHDIRIHALDFLRGLFIFIALGQHTILYLASLGYSMGRDTAFCLWFFSPWGEHLFLVLAAFNLAKRSRVEFVGVFREKLGKFALIFLLFVVEGFFVSIDLGAALSWHPLHTWMFVLATLAILFRYLGVWGVLTVFILQCGFWLMPMAEYSFLIQQFVRNSLLLPTFAYYARVDLFLGSGCAGFLLGYWYFHLRSNSSYLFPLTLGALLVLPFLVVGSYWSQDPAVFLDEPRYVVNQFTGAMYIWGLNALLILLALFLEHHWRPLRVPFLNWWGKNSLLIFVLHRAVLLHMLIPIRFYVGQLFSWPIQNVFIPEVMLVFLCIAFAWGLKKTKILLVLQGKDE